MKNTPLYICDGDAVYLDKISKYIMGRPYSPFIVKTMSEYDENIIKKIEEGIILISSNLLRERTDILDIQRTVILIDSELDRSFEEFEKVYKYQAAGIIFDKIMQHQLGREDICLLGNGHTASRYASIHGVISPIHRIGKTLAVQNMCQEAAKHQKVLLMTLEEFSKYEQEGEGLSEIIYYYKQGKLNAQYCIEHLTVSQDGYDFLLPVHWAGDLSDMQSQDWIDLVEAIQNMGIYDSIWIDFDHVSGFELLLKACDNIYIPYIEDEAECRRVLRFERMLMQSDEAETTSKIKKIKLEGNYQNEIF